MKTIQAELRAFLKSRGTTTDPELRSRNVEILLYLYGFGGPRWPKLREVASHFGLQDRQRVGQIEDEYLPAEAAAPHFAALRKCVRLMKTAPYWLNSVLTTTLQAQGLADPALSSPGLLRLAAIAGLEVDYATYVPMHGKGIVEVTSRSRSARATLEACPDFFLMDRQYAPGAASLVKRARTFHARYGLGRVADSLTSEGTAEDAERQLFLEHFLRIFEHGWVESHDGESWYLFEDTARHPVLTAARKVLSAVESCGPRALAAACRRYIAHREGTEKYSHTIAPEALIQRYLTTSRTFVVVKGRVRFREPGPSNLTPRESALVDHLRETPGGTTATALKSYLKTRDFEETSSFDKDLRSSPLVQVDRRGGPGQHVYFLVGTQPDEALPASEAWERRYAHYKERLQALDRTDIQSSSMSRTEQNILRDWLFKGKDELDCALCGKPYVVPREDRATADCGASSRRRSGLVAAHKKKRAKCSEEERRDPYIVMPLCLLGCDFVYEHRYVTIREGVIARGKPREGEDAVADYVSRLLDERERVADEWTKGCSSYFDDA